MDRALIHVVKFYDEKIGMVLNSIDNSYQYLEKIDDEDKTKISVTNAIIEELESKLERFLQMRNLAYQGIKGKITIGYSTQQDLSSHGAIYSSEGVKYVIEND